MKNLRIAGSFLQFNGGVTLLFGFAIGAAAFYGEGFSFNIKAVIPVTLFFIWCFALLQVGKGIKAANQKYRTPGLVVAAISLATSPVGLICGAVSLFYQIKGKESFKNA